MIATLRTRFHDTIGAPVNTFLTGNKLLGKPLRWYVTEWRLGLIVFALAILLPQLPPSIISSTLILTFTRMCIYVLLALGLNVVVGYAGLLDLGYVAFFAIGAYVEAIGTGGAILSSDGKNVIHFQPFSFWPMLLAGALIAGLFGVLLGAPTLRLRGDYLAIVTLGFGEIVPIVFKQVPWFYGTLGISAQTPGDIATPLGTITFSDPQNHVPIYYLALLLVAVVVVFVIALRDSSLGRAWIAIREDETAAESSGVNLVRTKLLAFGIGAMIGGVGGVLFAAVSTNVDPTNDFSFSISITVLAMIVLGGLGSLPGVIIGAGILSFVDVFLLGKINDYVQDPTNHVPAFIVQIPFNASKPLLYGTILLLMILLRPQGIIPNIRRQRELKGEGVAAEGLSVVGVLESAGASNDMTDYGGPGSDAQGRED